MSACSLGGLVILLIGRRVLYQPKALDIEEKCFEMIEKI